MEKLPALKIGHNDNVATVMHEVEKKEILTVRSRNGDIIRLEANEAIPFGHKIALETIKKGEPIVKYGETIGIASRLIEKGDYVHVHNIESQRGRGDWEAQV